MGISAVWSEARSTFAAWNPKPAIALLSTALTLRAAIAADCRMSAARRNQHRLHTGAAEILFVCRRPFLGPGATSAYRHPFGRGGASSTGEFLGDKTLMHHDDALTRLEWLKAALAPSRCALVSNHASRFSRYG
jgi:hypothetical protein